MPIFARKMIYLILSIISSVSVGILFKLIRSKTSANILLFTFNYALAASAAFYFFQPDISASFSYIPWSLVLPLIILLPGIFMFLPLAIKNSGIIKTDIAQRLSLIIPILCSFWLFSERISPLKFVALITGFLSVILILNKKNTSQKNSLYLLVIFFGYGCIDVLFKQVALSKSMPYTTVLTYIFMGCFFVCLGASALKFKEIQKNFTLNTVFYGILVGMMNFSNIFFYLKAHQFFKETPTTVFATMNFGVVLLGTLVGTFFFKEKLTKLNIAGLFLALLAITLIVLSQSK